MNKLALLAVGASLFTSLLAIQAQGISHQPSGAFGPWRYSTYLVGKIQFFDAKSQLIGTAINNIGTPNSGKIQISVNAQVFQFSRPGQHELFDHIGRLIGTAVIWPAPASASASDSRFTHMSPQEWGAEVRTAITPSWPPGAPAGITGMSSGAAGFDKHLGVNWKMLGPESVQVFSKAGRAMGSEYAQPLDPTVLNKVTPKMRANLLTILAIKQPVTDAIVHGHHQTFTGFGRHVLCDAHGKTVAILVVSPLNAHAGT